MNRAHQQALFQTTNLGLLAIRQSEINYYQGLNVAFGTQAALIGGFAYGVFSQNPVNDDNFYDVEVIADFYWVTSAITIALSVHVILCTMLMQVLGPGLALHGPVGSMARATEGMRIEQQQIIVSFVAMMLMFATSTVLSFWVVMTFEGAIGCTACFVIASFYWWKYCERIWLRFYWKVEDTGWRDGRRTNSIDDDLDDPDPAGHGNDYEVRLQRRMTEQEYIKKKRRGIMDYIFRGKGRHDSAVSDITTRSSAHNPLNTMNSSNSNYKKNHSSSSSGGGGGGGGGGVYNSGHDSSAAGSAAGASGSSNSMADSMLREAQAAATAGGGAGGATTGGWTWTPADLAIPNSKGVVMEGYLTMRAGSGGESIGSSSSSNGNGGASGAGVGEKHASKRLIDKRKEALSWERRYFTLSNTGNLFIYKTRQDYRTDPKSPIYIRPLRLMDHYVEVSNVDYEMREDNRSEVSERTNKTTTQKLGSMISSSVGAADDEFKPYRFQITLIPREHIDNRTSDLAVVNNNSSTHQSVVAPGAAAGIGAFQNKAGSTSTMGMGDQTLRDHWVLRCDTEDELQLWVSAIRDACPSCIR